MLRVRLEGFLPVGALLAGARETLNMGARLKWVARSGVHKGRPYKSHARSFHSCSFVSIRGSSSGSAARIMKVYFAAEVFFALSALLCGYPFRRDGTHDCSALAYYPTSIIIRVHLRPSVVKLSVRIAARLPRLTGVADQSAGLLEHE